MQRVVQREKELARSRVEKVLFSVVIWQPLLLYSFRLLSKFHLGVLIMGLSLFFYLIDQGPPEGWRGPEDNFEDGPWHDDERGPYPPGDSPMRGRGKPRGGRRGRGVRRWHQPFPSRRCGKLSYSVGISNVPQMPTGIQAISTCMHYCVTSYAIFKYLGKREETLCFLRRRFRRQWSHDRTFRF